MTTERGWSNLIDTPAKQSRCQSAGDKNPCPPGAQAGSGRPAHNYITYNGLNVDWRMGTVLRREEATGGGLEESEGDLNQGGAHEDVS